jgi:phosphomevalonate kinase
MKISAPGKLFLSGEWAVLEVGNPGIVTAVNKKVFVDIEEADEFSITVDDFGIKDVKASYDGEKLNLEGTDEEKERLIFMKGAIESTLKYLGEHKKFSIRSWGEVSSVEIEGEQKKVGFGSSAASVVATVGAVLALHGYNLQERETKDKIYKLAALAHYFAQGKVGSAFDVAASTYGGVFVYKRFDPKWLIKEVESKGVKEVVDQEWEGFGVEELDVMDSFRLLVGWTKESASTSAMVKQLNAWAETNREEYKRMFDGIADLVKELIPVWKSGEREGIFKLLGRNEELLRELGEKSGVNIETPGLKRLSEIAFQQGGAGKLSGAGGGDCGIGIAFDQETADKIVSAWKDNGLYIIDATVSRDGVKVDS